MKESYHDEEPLQKESWHGVPIVMHQRKISTFVNELIRHGFIIENMVEEFFGETDTNSNPNEWYVSQKAALVPPTIIFKASKPQ
ncbi:hypothetical protein [Weizmannia acidilactici]|nr:hypothetical protein [Weizmannia acidilactici]